MPQALSIPPTPATGNGAVTFETAARLCPSEAVAAKLSHVFSMDGPVDYEAIRRATRSSLTSPAVVLAGHLIEATEMALERHMRRVVEVFVRSAHDAGSLYVGKVAEVMEAKQAGGKNAVSYHAQHAADAGLQAYALLAAAHGAVDAYARLCGEGHRPRAGMDGDGAREISAAPTNAFNRD